ncbi:MAG: ABC transporter permease [Mucilaginibacter polytrichastri]|nr:ABC transporter permease [Mucilaginibacter polytrichastri]
MASPATRTWNRFRRNLPAFFSLIFIALSVFVALLGYLVIPDKSPDANRMSLPTAIRRPGSSFTFLLFRKYNTSETSLFHTLFFGAPAAYDEMAITAHRFAGDSIYVRPYIGDEETAPEQGYSLNEVLFNRHNPDGSQDIKAKKNRVKKVQIVERRYWLGSDLYGRDLLSRLVLGARISITVGLVSVGISLIVGVLIGSVSGYFGGWIDAFFSWLMNVLWSLPALLLVIALSFALGKGFWQVFIAIGLSMWVDVARLVRGQMIGMKQVEFVEAGRALGFSHTRLIFGHMLPNLIGPVLVLASSNFASAILLEAGLSFLGFGAQPPTPTWGNMIKEHYGYIIINGAYLAVLPGLAIMLLVYAFNLVTIGLRDAFDIRSQPIRD